MRDACVLGHSDGGTIALLLAASRPDLVLAMVIEAAHIYYELSIHTGISRMIAMARHNPKVTVYLAALHGEEKARTLVEHWLPHWFNAENSPPPLSRVMCSAPSGAPCWSCRANTTNMRPTGTPPTSMQLCPTANCG